MPTLANGAQCTLQFEQEGQIVQNVLNFIRFGGFDEAQVLQLADDVIAWWNGTMRNLTATNVTLNMVKARDLTNIDDPTFEVVTGLPIVASGGTALPNHCTVAMTLRTGLSGRRNRGRIYHVGLRADFLESTDKNIIVPGSLATLVAGYEELIDPSTFTDTGVGLAVWSRLGNSGRAVEAVASDGVMDSQRRRLPRRGR